MSFEKTIIYTDGSCIGNPGPGGWGFNVILDNREHDVSGGEINTTNNRMELTAVIEAIQFVPKNLNIEIYSDSMYVINGITKWIKNWKRKNFMQVKNTDLWKKLDKLCENRKINWNYVKAHNGDPKNELVDKLAKSEALNTKI